MFQFILIEASVGQQSGGGCLAEVLSVTDAPETVEYTIKNTGIQPFVTISGLPWQGKSVLSFC